MGKVLVFAAYMAYTAFWVRFSLHLFLWWRVTRRFRGSPSTCQITHTKACVRTAFDILFFGRLLLVNPALWFGEWLFHVAFLLVVLRHLRFFLNPVPSWVWSLQTPGLIAAYVLPLSLLYILLVRLLAKGERYSSPANMFLLALVLVISALGLLMQVWFKPNLVEAKLFAVGLVSLKPAAAPISLLFDAHFLLALALALFVPTHIFSAPLIMWEARKREEGLHLVMHDKK